MSVLTLPRVVGLIKNSGLPYTFGPMGTAIEGEWSEVMELLTRCHHELEKRLRDAFICP